MHLDGIDQLGDVALLRYRLGGQASR
jgi:hypothetical protein